MTDDLKPREGAEPLDVITVREGETLMDWRCRIGRYYDFDMKAMMEPRWVAAFVANGGVSHVQGMRTA